MAKEWYLLETPHNQLSGFEDDAFDDFAEEGFSEILDSALAVSVELYNYDLSVCLPVKAVIQNNVQDTKLKTLSRMMLVPIGTCKTGMYVKYKNRFWIITGLVDDNLMYEKAILSLCNWLLTWVNDKGKIIQRWANVTSASQYNNGETGERFYIVRSDQLLVVIPDDDESLVIPDGKRFIIDKRCDVYDKSINIDSGKDLSYSVTTYQLTRADSVINNYMDSGLMQFMTTQDEQHDSDGYYVVGSKGYWLCDEPIAINDKIVVLSSKIQTDENVIYCGLEPGIFEAVFYDENGLVADVEPKWRIDCNFADKLEVEVIDNHISIFADDSKLINKSFELFLSGSGYEEISLIVKIVSFI